MSNTSQPASDFERERSYPPEAYRRSEKVESAYQILARTMQKLGWKEQITAAADYLMSEAQIEQPVSEPVHTPQVPEPDSTGSAGITDLNVEQLKRQAEKQAVSTADMQNPLFRETA